MSPEGSHSDACNPVDLYVERHQPDVGVNSDESVPSPDLTVVLCHGFGGSARNFRPQIRLSERNTRFVLYDIRGHARSDKPRSADAYSLQCLVEDMSRVVASHATGKLIVGGLSLGAAIALDYALQYPQAVSGLLLAAYPAEPTHLRPWAVRFSEEIAQYGIERAGEEFVWGGTSRFDATAQRLIKAGFLEHAPWALSALLTQCLARLEDLESRSDLLQELRQPTRIVVGGADTGSIGPCQTLARLIPNATLTVLEGAGHVANLERALEFNEELRKLIYQVEAG
ncbi:MAG TPA: alpha/beta hydrolase [Polyangiaceae bacterium]